MTNAENPNGQYPPISELLVEGWRLDKSRLLEASVEDLIINSNALGGKSPIQMPQESLERLKSGLFLDVGCGLTFGRGTTFLDLLPNAYGIDPGLLPNELIPPVLPEDLKDRAIGGFAEHMPFKDSIFAHTMSLRAVGWYPNVTVNPELAISEMIRVTAPGGVINIHVGQMVGNDILILKATESVAKSTLGEKIGQIKDFTQAKSTPQVAIVLKD